MSQTSISAIVDFLQSHTFLISSLAILLVVVVLFFRNEDLREHLSSVGFSILLLLSTPLVWWIAATLTHSRMAGFLFAGCHGCFAIYLVSRVANRATNDLIGGFVFDMLFSEGSFAERIIAPRKLPNLTLLHHWRETGDPGKAFRAARAGLVRSQAAFPVWIFAAETAALHLQNLPAAIRIIRRLCAAREFSSDQKEFAVGEIKAWSARQGYDIDMGSLQKSYTRPPKPRPLTEIAQLRQRGDYDGARIRLRAILQRDPDNLAASMLLVRVYAQDLGLRRSAEQLIAELEKRPFVSGSAILFLRNSLEAWLDHTDPPQNASTIPPSTSTPKTASVKISLETPPIMKLFSKPATAASKKCPPPGEPDPSLFEGLSPWTSSLIVERRLGTAVEHLESLLKQAPEDFELLLQLAHVQIVHCGNLRVGERIVAKIDANPTFTSAQKSIAKDKLRHWREKYAETGPFRPY